MITLNVNDKTVEVDAEPDTPLLWVLRDHLGMTGTKFGCGVAACGACTVLLDGAPVRTCVLPLAACAGKSVTTIEGLGTANAPHPVQAAWIAAQVPQCGYCQSGMIMATVALLRNIPQPDDEDIARGVTNICRCGTYPRIKQAIKTLSANAPGQV
jgi:isoquinoline 1-oxidoreductase alpha subunit